MMLEVVVFADDDGDEGGVDGEYDGDDVDYGYDNNNYIEDG